MPFADHASVQSHPALPTPSYRHLVLLAAVLLGLAACGKKGNPLPPPPEAAPTSETTPG